MAVARIGRSDFLDGVGHHAPDRKFVAGEDFDRPVAVVGRQQRDAPSVDPHPLERELPVEEADRDAAIIRGHRTIDDEQVAVADAVPGHAVARDAHEEGRGGVVDKLPIQIQRSIEKVVGWRRKSRLDISSGNRKFLTGREVW